MRLIRLKSLLKMKLRQMHDRQSAIPTKETQDSEVVSLRDSSDDSSVVDIIDPSKDILELNRSIETRKQRYKLMVFLGFLFLMIVGIIAYTHILHHQISLRKSYLDLMHADGSDENVKFLNHEEMDIDRKMHLFSGALANMDLYKYVKSFKAGVGYESMSAEELFNSEVTDGNRSVRLFNGQGMEVLHGVMGMNLDKSKMRPCLPHHVRPDSNCTEWVDTARLHLSYKNYDQSNCYVVEWESLDKSFQPKDCFEFLGYWYRAIKATSLSLPKGFIRVSPDVSLDDQNSLYNSKGISILADSKTPLGISINPEDHRLFCFHAKCGGCENSSTEKFNYTICSVADVKHVHPFMIEKVNTTLQELKNLDLYILMTLLAEPVFEISSPNKELLSDVSLLKYTESIMSLGLPHQGYVLLNEYWQENVGDFCVDISRFPRLKEIIDSVHTLGLKVAFVIQPFISTNSYHFRELAENKLLVSATGTNGYAPALIAYKQIMSAGILDITSERAEEWLHNRLADLLDVYHLDGFYIEYGISYDAPHRFTFNRPLKTPDDFINIFTKSVQKKVSVLGVSSATVSPSPPTFVSLPAVSSSWSSLKQIVPMMLTYGTAGFPFVMPNVIGGNYVEEEDTESRGKDNETIITKLYTNDMTLMDQELYLRWSQLATFLPVVHYMHLPEKNGSEDLLRDIWHLRALRVEVLNPFFRKYGRQSLKDGLPLIRPLWMLDPTDEECLMVSDQFSIGEDLVVAPILTPGTSKRDVYLPAGLWKDGIDDTLRKGRRYYSYWVTKSDIPYFIRVSHLGKLKE